MWISCKFSSGGNFKYVVRRYETKLEVAFSNDRDEIETQVETFKIWLKHSLANTSYGAQFNKLHALCLVCNTGKELINLMKKDYGKRS